MTVDDYSRLRSWKGKTAPLPSDKAIRLSILFVPLCPCIAELT